MWVVLKIVVVTGGGWKPMVTRRRKDVCFPGPGTHPPPGSQLTRFPCALKRQKEEAAARAVENASCHNIRLKALNNIYRRFC